MKAGTSGKDAGKSDELGTLAVGKKPGIVFVSNVDENGNVTGQSRSERII